MSGYTLISCVGTGMYKKEGGYRETLYQFPDSEKTYKTSLFLKAILEIKYRPIKKVILVGTFTSGWDMLIPNPDSEKNISLWEKILRECENKKDGISEESIKELESMLPGWYNNIPFKIVIHTNEINQENVENIFSTYVKIPDLLEPDTDILFDISHGFRSMPILVFQSLQLNTSKILGKSVELIYGEYAEEENKSHARNLSKYWDYFEISSAIKLFNEKLDSKLLAEKIKPYWDSGAKFLTRFSEIVECNFSLQIPEALKQLKNTLANFNGTEKPQWVADVRNMLDDIDKKLNPKSDEKYPFTKTVWEYSKLLRDKGLITQAVIALQVTVETAIAEKHDCSKIGDYEWFYGYYDATSSGRINGMGIKELKKIREKDYKLHTTLEQLKDLRNQIAHGGGKNKKGIYPHQANINGILKPIDNAIEKLFSLLEDD